MLTVVAIQSSPRRSTCEELSCGASRSERPKGRHQERCVEGLPYGGRPSVKSAVAEFRRGAALARRHRDREDLTAGGENPPKTVRWRRVHKPPLTRVLRDRRTKASWRTARRLRDAPALASRGALKPSAPSHGSVRRLPLPLRGDAAPVQDRQSSKAESARRPAAGEWTQTLNDNDFAYSRYYMPRRLHSSIDPRRPATSHRIAPVGERTSIV